VARSAGRDRIDQLLKRRRCDPVGGPTGSSGAAVLHASATATAVAETAGQQQDYDDDEEDREHVHLPGLGCVNSFMTTSTGFSAGPYELATSSTMFRTCLSLVKPPLTVRLPIACQAGGDLVHPAYAVVDVLTDHRFPKRGQRARWRVRTL
jgi:hypothetical protein